MARMTVSILKKPIRTVQKTHKIRDKNGLSNASPVNIHPLIFTTPAYIQIACLSHTNPFHKNPIAVLLILC